MLARVARTAAARMARRSGPVSRMSQMTFSTATEETDVQKVVKDEMALSPKVQTVLDQILDLNMVEIAELSHAIQVNPLCKAVTDDFEDAFVVN